MRPFSHFLLILQLELTWPLTLVYMTFDRMNIWRFPYHINKPSLVPIGFQLFKRGHFHIFCLSYNLTLDDLWPWYIWLLTAWTYEGSHIISINQFNWTSTFQMRPRSHFQPILQLDLWWPLTLMWPLTSPTNEGSHVASMTQLWLKSIKACGR